MLAAKAYSSFMQWGIERKLRQSSCTHRVNCQCYTKDSATSLLPQKLNIVNKVCEKQTPLGFVTTSSTPTTLLQLELLGLEGGYLGIITLEEDRSSKRDCVKESHVTTAIPPTPPEVKQEENCDNHVNIGYAIRTLRDELPHFFYKQMSFSIYRDDITFSDPYNVFRGIGFYKHLFSSLRLHGRMFFRAAWVDIARIWQPCDNVIMIRWTMHGIARGPFEMHCRFDGVSEYKVDKEGKIYEHKVENVIRREPPIFHALTLSSYAKMLTYNMSFCIPMPFKDGSKD